MGNCEHCRFWEPGVLRTGICRRYPPAPDRTADNDLQPWTDRADWCGEFKERRPIAELIAALEGLRHDGCFCRFVQDSHAPYCVAATRALRGGEPK